jgi:hypothetical protein
MGKRKNKTMFPEEIRYHKQSEKKKNKYDSDAGMHFLMAINPQAAMNLADSKEPRRKKPPKSNERPRYPREIDNPRQERG